MSVLNPYVTITLGLNGAINPCLTVKYGGHGKDNWRTQFHANIPQLQQDKIYL